MISRTNVVRMLLLGTALRFFKTDLLIWGVVVICLFIASRLVPHVRLAALGRMLRWPIVSACCLRGIHLLSVEALQPRAAKTDWETVAASLVYLIIAAMLAASPSTLLPSDG